MKKHSKWNGLNYLLCERRAVMLTQNLHVPTWSSQSSHVISCPVILQTKSCLGAEIWKIICLVNRDVEEIRFPWHAEWFQILFSSRNIKITGVRNLLINISIKIMKRIFIKQFIIELRVMMNYQANSLRGRIVSNHEVFPPIVVSSRIYRWSIISLNSGWIEYIIAFNSAGCRSEASRWWITWQDSHPADASLMLMAVRWPNGGMLIIFIYIYSYIVVD